MNKVKLSTIYTAALYFSASATTAFANTYWEPRNTSYWQDKHTSHWQPVNNSYWMPSQICTQKETNSIYVQPIPGINQNFIRGVDISTLLEVEKGGGKFYDESGKAVDAINFLASKGINWVRLRLWNNPYDINWVNTHAEWLNSDGAPNYAVSPFNGSIGAGTNDLATTIAIAQRAKNAGMQLLLDFHYSDFWADPGKQYSPEAWNGLSEIETEQAVYDFTFESLQQMAASGVLPDMVQIGNEINDGLLWGNNGRWNRNSQPEDPSYNTGLRYLAAGIKAVRASDHLAFHYTQIMLHLADGNDHSAFENVFGAFNYAQLDYDIIGASYYPYWHGALESLQENLDKISTKYNKKIIIAETAYGFTEEYSPDGGDIFNSSSVKAGGYLATVQGQATAVREVMNTVARVPQNRGLGIFYWEPAWLANMDIDNDGYRDGAGWIYNQPSSWDNQAFFDYEGKALASLDVFNKVYKSSYCGKKIDPPHIVNIATTEIKRRVGDPLDLPDSVQALYNDDAYRPAQVIWNITDSLSTSSAGQFIVTGEAEGISVTATLNVNANIVENGGFENWTTVPWDIPPEGAFQITGDNPYEGEGALHFWSNEDMESHASQIIENIVNGVYRVSVWTMGSSAGKSNSNISITSNSLTVSSPAVFNGWGNWNQATVCLPVTNNKITVTLTLEEIGSSWGEFDEVHAVLVEKCE